jgi:hypothetical protein
MGLIYRDFIKIMVNHVNSYKQKWLSRPI